MFLSFKLETTDRSEEVAEVLRQLTKLDMNGVDISDNELAKSHARYMIGGRADVPNERVFRFGACKCCSLNVLPLILVRRIPGKTKCSSPFP